MQARRPENGKGSKNIYNLLAAENREWYFALKKCLHFLRS